MTTHDDHRETRPHDKPLPMPGFFNSLTNPPVRRERSELAAQAGHHPQTNPTAEQQRQATLAAVQQHRADALAAQQQLAATRTQDTQADHFRKELARIQQLCHQNRRADTCPPECVVRQWRRGVPLGELNGMEAFRRRLNGSR